MIQNLCISSLSFLQRSFSVGVGFLLAVSFAGCMNPTLSYIKITPEILSLPVGTSAQLTATGYLEDESTEDITATAVWTSLDDIVATVSMEPGSEGRVTAVSPGTTYIKAERDGKETSLFVVVTETLNEDMLQSVRIDPELTLVEKGTAWNLALLGTVEGGAEIDLTEMTEWSSSDELKVSVSNTPGTKGLATARTVGKATLTAAIAGQSAHLKVEVLEGMEPVDETETGSESSNETDDPNPPLPVVLASVEITPTEATVGYLGDRQFKATAVYSDGASYDVTSAVRWESSDSAALVFSGSPDEPGLARALVAQDTHVTVTAIYEGIQSSINVSIACVKPENFDFGGEGTEENPYLVCAPEQLPLVSKNGSAHYLLMRDLNFNGEAIEAIYDPAIRGFSGTFDGQGHRIENFMILRSRTAESGDERFSGLFVRLIESSKVLNLTLAPRQVAGNYVGALAGEAVNSWIVNCHVVLGDIKAVAIGGQIFGKVSGGLVARAYHGSELHRVSVRGIEIWSPRVGGIVYEIEDSRLEDGFTRAALRATSKSSDEVAGIAVNVYETTIMRTYASTVFHGVEEGGPHAPLVLTERGSGVWTSIYDLSVMDGNGSPFGVGLTDTQMKLTRNFQDWDFENVWIKDPEDGYPVLR